MLTAGSAIMNERTPVATPPPRSGPDWAGLLQRPRFIGLLLAAVTLAVFWQVRNCDFINYDDPAYVTSNPHVERGLSLSGMRWALGSTQNGNWHPLTWLSHMLDADLFGSTPAGPHALNLLLHVANTVLLFRLLRDLTGAHWPSAFVAALFALHPLHVESVAWISERKDVLSTFFLFLTLWTYMRYAQTPARAESREPRAGTSMPAFDPRPSTLDYWLALLFFGFALMSKPMAVTLPFVLLLLDYWPLGRVAVARCRAPGEAAAERQKLALRTSHLALPWTLVREKVPFFLLSAVVCGVTLIAQRQSGALYALTHLTLGDRVGNAFVSWARYLGKLFWPVNLAVPYPHPGQWPMADAILGAALVAAVSAAALGFARKLPFLFTGWFWFLGTLIPVIGLVQVGIQSMADRYTYVPSIGIFIALAWGIQTALARWRMPAASAGVAALVLLTACAARTMNQLRYWHNSGTLFRHALDVTQNNYVAHDNLAAWCFDQGRLDEALEHCRASLRINPADALARNNLGHGLFLQGRIDEAIEEFNRAIELKPDYASAWLNLGSAFLEQKRYPDAIRCYEKAVQLRPDSAEAHHRLGGAFLQQREYARSIPCFEAALRLRPDFAAAHVLLGTALAGLGKIDDAIRHYDAALRLTPDDAAARAVLAEMLLGRGRAEEAAEQYREVLRSVPGDVAAHLGLGRALAKIGQRDEAVAELKEALRLNPGDPEAEKELRALGAAARPRPK